MKCRSCGGTNPAGKKFCGAVVRLSYYLSLLAEAPAGKAPNLWSCARR